MSRERPTILSDLAPKLVAIDRYERRALSRQVSQPLQAQVIAASGARDYTVQTTPIGILRVAATLCSSPRSIGYVIACFERNCISPAISRSASALP